MGMDASCTMGYGFVVELYDLPWQKSEERQDLDDWWREKNGYKPPFDLYDDKGNFIVNPTPQSCIDEWYAHRREWDHANPLPFGLIVGNEGEDEAILTCNAVTPLHFDWDYGVQEVDPARFTLTAEQFEAAEKTRAFLEAEGIKIKRGPAWYAVCDYS